LARNVDKRLVVVLVLAAVLLVWFIRGLHWEEVFQALRNVKIGYLLLAAGLMLGDYFFRAVRWMLIVRQVDREVPLATVWHATAIGAALNTFLPLRGGDLVRPALVAHDRQAPFTTLLSTTVLERLFDAFGVLMALVVILLAGPEEEPRKMLRVLARLARLVKNQQYLEGLRSATTAADLRAAFDHVSENGS